MVLTISSTISTVFSHINITYLTLLASPNNITTNKRALINMQLVCSHSSKLSNKVDLLTTNETSNTYVDIAFFA